MAHVLHYSRWLSVSAKIRYGGSIDRCSSIMRPRFAPVVFIVNSDRTNSQPLIKIQSWRKTLILIVILFCVPSLSSAQPFEYKLKAEFLERFTRFIDWPTESAVSDTSKPFCICVIGQNPFGPYLKQLADTVKIKGKVVEVHEMQDSKTVDICQIVFIPQTEKSHLGEILKLTQNKPILTVADTDGFGGDGVLINFYETGSYIRFEINMNAVERSKLKFSSRLLKLARLV
jgi:hypothetical protein